MATPTLSVTNWASIEDCDAVTGFSNISGGAGVALNEDVFRQGTGAVGRRIDNSSDKGFSYDMGTAIQLDFAQSTQVTNATNPVNWGERLGFWFNTLQPTLVTSFRFGVCHDTATPASNRVEWELVPKNSYNGGWVHFCVDPRQPGNSDVGTGGGIGDIRYLTFIWDMGNVGGTLNNCIIDSIRRGTGIGVTGGTTSDKVTWDDVEAVGNSATNAYGLIQARSGVFFMQGGWEFGAATGDCYFEDSGKTCIWTEDITEDRATTPNDYQSAGNDFNKLTLTEGTGTTSFINGTKVGTGDAASGVGGCTYQTQVSAASGSLFQQNTLEVDFSDAAVTAVELYGCVFTRCLASLDTEASLLFSDDATNGPNHEVMGCFFDGCGRVEPGRVVMRDNTFANTRQSNQATGYFDYVAGRDEAHTAWNVGTTSVKVHEPATQFEALLRDGGGDHSNSAVYFGYRDQFAGFAVMSNNEQTVEVWEYWNGSAWSSLTIALLGEMNWDVPNDATAPSVAVRGSLINRLTGYLSFTPPSDWEKTTVNTSELLYFIRYRETTNIASGAEADIAFAHPLLAPNGAALNWASNIDIKNSNFVANADADSGEKAHGIEHEVEGTFTYTGLTFSGNDADLLFSDSSTLVEEMTTGFDTIAQLGGDSAYQKGWGMSFTGDGSKVSRIAMHLGKNNSPTGNLVGSIFAHSGTFGTSSVPTGVALAQTEILDVSTLNNTGELTELKFVDDFTLVNTTKYVLAVQYDGGDFTNYVEVGYDNNGTGAAGNGSSQSNVTSNWAAQVPNELLFQVWGDTLVINASDGAPVTYTIVCKGSVLINTTVDITLTGLVTSPGTEVRVYEAGTTNEIDGVESEVTGSFTFQAEAAESVDIVIHNVEYVPIRLESFTIPSVTTSIPISMRFDRNYSNP